MASVFGVPIPTIESSSHTIPTFYYLGAAAYTEEYGFLGYRNCGIFWEPGLYQIYLNFALIYFLYSPKLFYKNKWLVVFYLIFSVYTTGSTTGLFLCAFIIGYYMIFNSKMNNAMKFIVITVAIVLSGGVIYSYLLLNLTTKMDSASYLARMTDLTFGFEVFKEKPFLGYGIANDIYTAKFSAMFGIERGDSNGLMNLLISFGLIGLVVYVISLYRFAKSCVSIFADRVILLVLLWAIVSLCTEPISTHATVFFFMGIGLGNRIYNCKEHITHEHRISDIGLNKYSGFIDNFQVND